MTNGSTTCAVNGDAPVREDMNGSSTDSLSETVGPLAELVRVFERHIVLPPGASIALGLWVLHTHMFRDFYFTPRLIIRSPVKQCGKTNVLSLLERLAANSRIAAHVSPAAMFRLISSKNMTLLIDEVDTFLKGNADYRYIINSGHRKDGRVVRCEGDMHEPREFATFGPVALAGIGRLPDTIEDRSVVIELKRKLRHERVERIREDRLADLDLIKERSQKWIECNRETIRNFDPHVPDCLSDRAADNWRPLLAIAESAGGEWPTRAREAAEILDRSTDADSSHDILLLEDIKQGFSSSRVGSLSSAAILGHLNGRDDRPWSEINAGGPMTAPQLAKRLKPFGIGSKQLWVKGRNERGYEWEQFRDAFARYLPPIATRPLEASNEAEFEEIWLVAALPENPDQRSNSEDFHQPSALALGPGELRGDHADLCT